jgi:uncharacterized protein YggT (Ycf19 family)
MQMLLAWMAIIWATVICGFFVYLAIQLILSFFRGKRDRDVTRFYQATRRVSEEAQPFANHDRD